MSPAGWYPDPQLAATQRFWDGNRWTEQVAPLPPPGQAAEKEKLDVLAIVLAVIPLIGVVAGLVLLMKHKPRNGGIMIAVGVTSSFASRYWSGSSDPPSTCRAFLGPRGDRTRSSARNRDLRVPARPRADRACACASAS